MNPSKKSTSGNILIYVLVAIVLFGALTFILAKTSDGDSTTNGLKEGEARLRSEDLINFATNMRVAIENMVVLQNVLPTELSFLKLGDTGYDDEPHTAKVYHPAGGGVTLFNPKDEMYTAGSAKRGWVVQQGTNVGWTQTTGSDVILTFLDVAEPICREINERIYKDSTIPTTTISTSAAFINGGGDDADFTASACTSCNQRNSFCVKDSGGANVFYNVVLAR